MVLLAYFSSLFHLISGTPYFTNSGPCLFDFTIFLNDLIIAEDVLNLNTKGKTECTIPSKQNHSRTTELVKEKRVPDIRWNNDGK